MSDHPAPWLPADFSHPTRVELDSGLHLRPIRASDVDIDLPAVMGSRLQLRDTFGEEWGWPPATMTAAQDYEDLDRHEQEIARHESFNYALLNTDETALYGCLYLDPDGQGAEVSWWVVDQLVATPVEQELAEFVPRWLAARWPFADVRYPFNSGAHAADAAESADGANGADEVRQVREPREGVRTPLPEPDSAAGEAMWRAYCANHPEGEGWTLDNVSAFGDSVELADELIGLVVRGVKRATASLVRDYPAEQEPLPRIGGHWVACDGSGTPRVVLRTVELRLGTADSVQEAFAWDEGEGDRSRTAWLASHRGYWQRTLAARGEHWHPSDEVVFERFAVVWPPEAVQQGLNYAGSVAARPVVR
ncbi:MAG TPA: ASCH domain-containing protein [Propionibacteriaceae bacterium]|nr:ASCH domain-containing protein [Propionibacteriaceae bacterium]